MQILKAIGAITAVLALVWWAAYAVTHFKGWTALPLTITGALVCVALAVALAENDEDF